MKVAFLGLGRMGVAMAMHVLDAGHELTVWNRSSGKADELVAKGAREAPSPAEAVRDADAAVLMLTAPDVVRDVLFGDDGVAAGAPDGLLVIDSTTIGPEAAREFHAEASKRGLRYVEAPVAGSVKPATDGVLVVLAGGDNADVEAAKPLLGLWGDEDKLRVVGPIGSGNALKSVVNAALGHAIAALGEQLRLAKDLGIDRDVAMAALSAGPSGWAINYKGDMLRSGTFTPPAFTVDLLDKDLGLALDAAQRPLPITTATREAVGSASKDGHGDEDFAAVAAWLETSD